MSDSIEIIAWCAVILGLISSLIVIADILAGNRQHMAVMNVVWPVTALYAGPLALWGYFTVGRLATHRRMHAARRTG